MASSPAATTLLDRDRVLRIRDRLGGRDWAAVTLTQIAEAADVSRMTLHRHGIGKDEVLTGIGTLLEAEHREAIFPALTSDADGRTRLTDALTAICAVEERSLGWPVRTPSRLGDALRRILEDGVADGTLRAADPKLTAAVLFEAAGSTYRQLRRATSWSPDEARAAIVALLLDGVAAPS
jgi:AcrR family transcriptional regulator